MRIVGGRLAGRRFGATKGRGTRPTSDRAREAIASALEARGAFDGARVLDLFAGSGALSFEALSRGAAEAVAIDGDPLVLRQISQSASDLGLDASIRTARIDLLGDPAAVARRLPRAEHGFDLVFVDAPYSQVERIPPLLEAIVESGSLSPSARVVVERPAAFEWAWPNGLAPEAEYRYGHTGVSFGLYEVEKGIP